LDVFAALESGAVAVTATSRLARDLRLGFHGRQRDLGRKSWQTADVLPLDSLLKRLWTDWLYSARSGSAPVLLSEAQETAIWEGIIGDPENAPLLDVPGTAVRASEAWRLVHQYDLPIREGNFRASDDCEAFLGWAREYEQTCRDNWWLDRGTLPEFLLRRLASDEVPLSGQILYVGFDELTPLERRLFKALGAQGIELPRQEPVVRRLSLADAEHEIESAAAWARATLDRENGARIGVVVPDLTARRSAVQRVFQRTFDGLPFGEASQAFHLSLGPPLAEYPAIHAALLILEAAIGPISIARAGMLLRSHFIEASREEASARAALDARLRRRGSMEFSIDELRSSAGGCPVLQKHLAFLGKRVRELAGNQTASAWSDDFSDLLKSAGWPGEESLDSASYQAAQAWRDLLGEFSSLDLALLPMGIRAAWDRLRRLAGETLFQPEDRGAPVQVMGVLEAKGLRFDHLWITGLHDGAFPAPASPHPFLPLGLQRDCGVPGSSAGLELERSRRALDRLVRSGARVTLSFPSREGEQELRKTPLIAGSWEAMPLQAPLLEFTPTDSIADNQGPALTVDGPVLGGATLLKEMSACPFRAFARFRLGARALEDAAFGLSYRDRGSGVHGALDEFWKETKSHAALCELAEHELHERIGRSVDKALEKQSGKIAHKLETKRLRGLLSEWMKLERLRKPFQVLFSEEKTDTSLGGLKLTLRIDRVDELPDGRLVILDYKTGKIVKTGWDGERPAEPQLPIYAVALERPVAALAFARVRTGGIGFTGIDEADTLGVMRTTDRIAMGVPLAEQTNLWRTVLENLAEGFRSGEARVDPLPSACEYCDLRSLCRIRAGDAAAAEGDA
jgi:probable DNA repair protein